MARRNGHKSFKQTRNRGQHQRRRSTRGGRLLSKLIKGGKLHGNDVQLYIRQTGVCPQ